MERFSAMGTALRKYTNTSLRKLEKSLKDFAATGEPEELHVARVEIKKIKSVLKLLRAGTVDFKFRKTFLPFRSIFRSCRAVREPLVLLQLATDKKVRSHFPVQPNAAVAIRNLRREIPVHLKAVRPKYDSILKHAEALREDRYSKYIRKKIKKLKNRVYPKLAVKAIHPVRKLVKETYYLESLSKGNALFRKFLKAYGNLAGDWHDQQLLINAIRKTAPVVVVQKLQNENRERVVKLRKLISAYYGNK